MSQKKKERAIKALWKKLRAKETEKYAAEKQAENEEDAEEAAQEEFDAIPEMPDVEVKSAVDKADDDVIY